MHVAHYWSHSFIPELVRADGIVIDAGVNSGGFSLLMAGHCATVVGFEPDPVWQERLRLPPNCVLVPKAIAAHAGILSLHVNKALCSSLHHSEEGSRVVEVEAITLEEALALVPPGTVDLLKMDIEGEEVPVLESSPDAVLRRIAQITVEFHDFLDATQVPAIRGVILRLRSLGFAAFRFSLRNYGDMLFVNQRLKPLSPLMRLLLLLRFKYLRGMRRVVDRALERAGW